MSEGSEPDQWSRAIIALGSNVGAREEHLLGALADLRAAEGIRVLRHSSVHHTVALTAHGYDDTAPEYLNQVIAVESAWQPEALMSLLLSIESRHGRIRHHDQYAWRTLDLDLIDYGGMVFSSPTLTLPHPRAHERRFVLEPWQEIDPDATLVGHGRVADILARLEGV